MRNSKNVPVLIIGIVSLAWFLAVLFLRSGFGYGTHYWLGMGLSLVIIAVSLLSTWFFISNGNAGDTPSSAIPIVLTAAFFLAGIIRNTAEMFSPVAGKTSLLIVFTIIATGLYLILMIFFMMYSSRLMIQNAELQGRQSLAQTVSSQLGMLLAGISDPDIKAAVKTLKETVDYSNTSAQQNTVVIEKKVLLQIEELRTLIEDQGERTSVIEKVAEIQKLWNSRNAVSAGK